MSQIIKGGVIDLFEHLLKSVKDLGVEETTNILKLSQNKLNLINKEVEFVLRMVTTEFNISTELIINSKSKSIKRKFSIMFLVYYLHDSFKISFGDISQLLKRDRSLIHKYYHEIKSLSTSEKKADEGLKKYKNKFDLLVTDFKINKTN